MGSTVVGQPQFLKEVNIHIINTLIIEKGPITKPQIAAITGLSLPTVNKIVDSLEKENKVCPSGMLGQSVGRKARLYVANGGAGNVLALHISQRSCISCVVNMVGEIIYRFTFHMEEYANPTAAMKCAIQKLMENCTAAPLAIGIAIPGVVDEAGFISAIDTIPQWEGVCLKKEIEGYFNLPVYVENNARLAAIGFYNSNLKNQYKDVVYLHMGSGISSGIILNSLLHKGFSCFAGELGYMYLQEKGSMQPRPGRLEGEITQLLDKLQEEKEQACATKLKERLVEHLGHIVVNLVCLLNPQVVVLRGTEATTDLAQAVKEAAARYVPQRCMPSILVDNSELSGIKGILYVCRQQIAPAYNIVLDNKV